MNGESTYTPNKDFFGTDTASFRVYDNKGASTVAKVTFTVNPINDAPTAQHLSVTIDEDNPVSIAPVARDADGDTLSFGIEAGKGPSHGSVLFNAQTGKFDYTPAKDFFGSDSFTYTVSDGKGGTTSATASITINPINDAPALSDMTASTDEDNSVSFKLLAVDPEGDLLNFTIAGGVDHGSLLLNTLNGESTYTPNKDFFGTDTASFRVYDNKGASTVAKVTFTVNPINDAPTAQHLSVTIDEDNPVSIAPVARDADGDTLSFGIEAGKGPSHGSVLFNAQTGKFDYTPNKDFFGSDSFTYTVSDGKGGTTSATASITINPINDAPALSDMTASTDEDNSVSFKLLAVDPEGDLLNFTIAGGVDHGSLLLNTLNGESTYTPNKDFFGTDTASFRVYDNKGASTVAKVTFTVNPINDAPTAQHLSVTIDEDNPVSIAPVTRDADGDTLSFSIEAGNGPRNGSVLFNAQTGKFDYTPNKDFFGSDSFTYTVSDGKGGTTSATASITINPINDAPALSDMTASTDEDNSVSFKLLAVDPEGDLLNFTIAGGVDHGSLLLNTLNGESTYTPNKDFFGTDTASFRVYDSANASVVVNVTLTVLNPGKQLVLTRLAELPTDQDTDVGIVGATLVFQDVAVA